MRIGKLNLVSVGSATSIDGYLPLDCNGFALVIKVIIPDCTGTPTATLTIYDLDGYAIFTKSGIPENATTIIHALTESKDIPVTPGAKVNLTFTSAPGNGLMHELTFFVA